MGLYDPELFLDDSLGVYIPRDFAEQIVRERVTGVSDDQYAALADPASDSYWIRARRPVVRGWRAGGAAVTRTHQPLRCSSGGRHLVLGPFDGELLSAADDGQATLCIGCLNERKQDAIDRLRSERRR
jgi:hypothetical protein